MWSKVRDYIEKNNLLNNNKLYIVALSGGADSVALLLLLKEGGFNVHAAHCNFHLRGAESDRDEAFCVELCRRLGVELHRAHFDTCEYAEVHQVSIEMAARELRYSWFARLCQDVGAEGVCVAHHRDDLVETVLLNTVRGTGLRGLTGIRPKILSRTRGQFSCEVIRPLLCVTRAEIEAFLVDRGQEFVMDSTNLKTDVQRNKVRLQVLPLLRELNPAVTENIWKMAENLTQAQDVLDEFLLKYKNDKELNISEINSEYSRRYIAFEWLKNYGFNGSQVGQILEAETGKVVSSPLGYDVLKDRGRLLVEPSLKPQRTMRIPEEGTYVVSENDDNGQEKVAFRVRRCDAYVSKAPYIATLDAAKVMFPLTVRQVEDGDWMQPYGMKGRKLLSDMMTDLKMTVFEKRRQLIVADAQGIVVWAVGLRTDQRVAVTSQTTEVLEIALC